MQVRPIRTRARSWPCDIVVRCRPCRPLRICKRRRVRRAALLRCGRLHRLRRSGACRQRDAARRHRQLGVPVEDHETVRPSTDALIHAALNPTPFVFSGTSPPTHRARRVIDGYPGLVGTVPSTISTLTALTHLCVRPSSSRCGPCRAARAHGCACAPACSTERDQALGQVWLRRS